MSKGSNFWGTARGKLGNMVISSVKGQQVERKYQPQVANPKTFAQMRQRAVFALAVKFFKHSQQNLFKFAYEDKTQKESDYNAFMRHNVKCFTPIKKAACDNPTLPALGFFLNLQLSFGSLPSANAAQQFYKDTKIAGFGLDVGDIPEDPTQAGKKTWGQVSKALVKKFGLADGDILTFVVVDTKMLLSEFTQKYLKGENVDLNAGQAKWTITQKSIDSISDEDVSSQIVDTATFIVTDGIGVDPNSYIHLGSVIFSRNVKGRSLMVSTSTFDCSVEGYEDKLVREGSVEEENILNSWGANPEAILKGALL